MFWEHPNFEIATGFVQSVFESNFFTALAGAFAGAYAAQRVADKSNERSSILQEFRSTNTTIAITCNMTTTFLTLKKQFTKPYVEQFKKDKLLISAAFSAANAAKTPIQYRPHLIKFPMPAIPVERLQQLLASHSTLPGATLNLGETLFQSIESLQYLFLQRSEFIDKFEQLKDGAANPDQLACIYFGLPTAEQTDSRHADLVGEIELKNDDCIQYAIFLARRLEEHGSPLRKNLKMSMESRGFNSPAWTCLRSKSPYCQMKPNSKTGSRLSTRFLRIGEPPTCSFWRFKQQVTKCALMIRENFDVARARGRCGRLPLCHLLVWRIWTILVGSRMWRGRIGAGVAQSATSTIRGNEHLRWRLDPVDSTGLYSEWGGCEWCHLRYRSCDWLSVGRLTSSPGPLT